MPMFPLGSVLFPAMPTALRIFEERYIVMLSSVLQDEPSEFGIVLIERGSEVGGGEQRFPVGTIAQIAQVQASEGFIGLVAQGTRRIEVEEWLDDDPYPRAKVRDLPELEWHDALGPLFDEAESTVRRALAQASEFVEQQWGADVELSADRVEAMWQLAGIAPVGPLDQVKLLGVPDSETLLRQLIDAANDAVEMLAVTWVDTDDFPTADDFRDEDDDDDEADDDADDDDDEPGRERDA